MGVTLIVINGLYHLIWRGEIRPDFKQYPSYPGNKVYRGLVDFRSRYPNYAFHQHDDVFDHWERTEGDVPKARLDLRLRVYKIRKQRHE